MTTILTPEPLSVQAAYDLLEDPTCGAAVVFVGRVRDHHDGRDVTKINYTAYADMVRSEGDRIVAEARAAYDISKSLIIHRVGMLHVGEISIVVGVASKHRAAGFSAAAWMMDEIKKRLPIWKEEF